MRSGQVKKIILMVQRFSRTIFLLPRFPEFQCDMRCLQHFNIVAIHQQPLTNILKCDAQGNTCVHVLEAVSLSTC